MTDNDLRYFKSWFDDYTRSFYSSDTEDQKNIILKVVHSHDVCRNIVRIAEGSSLSSGQIRAAETVALFHDIGRLSQYAKYKTFRDALSVNHGLLGSKVLKSNNILRNLSDKEQQLIINVVKFHNAFAIPKLLDEDAVLFLKMVRDADKIDIFRVFLEYYESPAEERASATAFRVPDSPEYSGIMLSCIIDRKVASYSNIRTENDFKLMKLSWVYDMNFRESIKMLKEKDYIRKTVEKLPQTDEIMEAMEVMHEYMAQRLKDGNNV